MVAAVAYECLTCRDSEFVTHEKDGYTFADPCLDCKAMRLERRNRAFLAEHSTLGRHRAATFALVRPAPGLYGAYTQAVAFAADPRGTLALLGPYGAGKSLLAACIAHAAAPTTRGLFIEAVALLGRLKDAYAQGRDAAPGATFSDLLKRYRTVPLLVLDDLGTEHRTEFATETLFAILSDRYNEELATVITSNEPLGALGGRLASRLLDRQSGRVAVARAGDARRGLPVSAAGLEWYPRFDVRATATAWHALGSGPEAETVVCPTCDSWPCLTNCTRQMWKAT